jgi:hypothetical protein
LGNYFEPEGVHIFVHEIRYIRAQGGKKTYNVYDRSNIPKCKNTGHGRSFWSSTEKRIQTSEERRKQSKGWNKQYSKESPDGYPVVLYEHKQCDGKITHK